MWHQEVRALTTASAFRVRCIQPLCHLSARQKAQAVRAVFSGGYGGKQGGGTNGLGRGRAHRPPPVLRLEFAAEFAVERIWPAAAQRDGEAQQAPQQHIFITAFHPVEPVAAVPIGSADTKHFASRGSSREK